jgi:hypothetical protein
VLRLGDRDELLAEQEELRRQLDTNEALSQRDRELLGARIAQIEGKLAAAAAAAGAAAAAAAGAADGRGSSRRGTRQ